MLTDWKNGTETTNCAIRSGTFASSAIAHGINCIVLAKFFVLQHYNDIRMKQNAKICLCIDWFLVKVGTVF